MTTNPSNSLTDMNALPPTPPRRHSLARLGALWALAALTACGGGGGGGGAESNPTPSASPSPSPSTPPPPATGGGSTGGGTTPGQALGAVHTGSGTFYGATGEGNCSFDASPGNLMVAAMNHVDYAGSAVCGEYVEVTGPNGTATVRITDQCPECAAGDIDLSAQAFAAIADPAAGRVSISWKVVAGNVTGPVQYRYKEGSTRFWTAIQVRNHRVPISKLEILPSGSSSWIEVARTDYNYFIYPTPIAAGPLQVRITGLTGATLQDSLPEPQGGLVLDGSGQFPQ